MADTPRPASAPRLVEVDPAREGQRIDNFLAPLLKGVPRSAIYRLLRTGQVRVNKGRIRPDYRVQAGDLVRVPPVVTSAPAAPARLPAGLLEAVRQAIIYEDDDLLVIDKPAGVAVHGGSGLRYGLIEALRAVRPGVPDITLVHRLDRETSGCLLVAKNRRLLPALHEEFKGHRVEKRYQVLVAGRWEGDARTVRTSLSRGRLRSGERMVEADQGGKEAETRFVPVARLDGATLVEATIRTGRTHQIRVHAAELGHPVAGDTKYGDPEFNHAMRALGLKRMFLHARVLRLPHPTGGRVEVECPLPEALEQIVDALRPRRANRKRR